MLYKKIINLSALLICLIVFNVYFASDASADTISEKKQEINNLQKEINENRSELTQKSRDVNSLQNQISILGGQIKDTELQISLTQANIDITQAEIDQLISQIEQKEYELSIQKENLSETLRAMYETPQQSTLEIIVGSNSLSDIMNRTQYTEALQNRIDITMNVILQIKAELENKRNEQEKKKQELSSLLEQQKNYRKGLAEQKAAKDDLLYKTKGEEANYRQLLTQGYAELEKANAELRRMEGGTIGVAGSYPVTNWPMYGYISAPFGACGCDAYFCGRCHTGIDIVAPPFTEIKAAKDGTVIDTTNSCPDFKNYACGGGYGNRVKVRHDDGYTAIYGHMALGTVRVSIGDRVRAGSTVLGQEGSTGWSTGYHLHFEIRTPDNIPVGAALP